MYSDLKGKTAFITGAGFSTGIGFGIARSLAESGMDIILADLPCGEAANGKRPIDHCCELLKHEYGIKTLAVEMDVTVPHDVGKALATVQASCTNLHALVNNAGANMGATRVGDYDPALWSKVLDINLLGPFRLIKALLPMMIRGSSIINIASRAGKRPLPTCSAYSTSKAGLIMLTKCVAVEYAPLGIRANALCPGQILTEMNLKRYSREAVAQQSTREDVMARAIATVPLGRIGTPEDVGRAAAFLASESSSYITGQALNVTGGQIMEI